MTTICFTGHRPKALCGYVNEAYRGFVAAFVAALLTDLSPFEEYTFISGGAQGFDQLAFWAVDAAKKTRPDFHNCVYVPFEGQSSIWAPYGTFSQAEYAAMLQNADMVKILNTKPADNRQVPKLLTERNHRMVNDSDIVIALYEDDNWSVASSGTAECMRYAARNGKKIIRLPYTIIKNRLTADFSGLSALSA